MGDSPFTTLHCPACAHALTSPLVGAFEVAGTDTDFCPQYRGGNPLPALVHVCPLCGYCGFEPDFAPIEDESVLDGVRGALRALEWQVGQLLSGAERYRRTALLAVWLGKSNAEIAELWMQAMWCSRLDGEPEQKERRLRQKAIKYFEIALAEGEFGPEDTAAVHYLLGELKRRAGRPDAALEEFSRVTPEAGADGELLLMRDMQLDAVLSPEACTTSPSVDASGAVDSGLDFSEYGGVDPSARYRNLRSDPPESAA